MLKGPLRARLEQLAARADELQRLLADPRILGDPHSYQKHAKEYGFVSRVAAKQRHLAALERRRSEASSILADAAEKDLAELARQEMTELDAEQEPLEREIEGLLLQDDVDARRNVIMEIRAGTGGDEAALFVADLFRMYAKYAESRGWKTEIVSSHGTELGGFREVIFDIRGQDVYSALRYESGGHRVQRVPVTEASGRIHTSAVTVAVLPEAEEVDVQIAEKDLKIDRFCASGPGGQHVNKTASAIRITHVPTGLVVSCQDEKSQHKNLAKAMRVLRSRLYERERTLKKAARDAERRAQIGSGDRSDRVRTYNFPQNRLTDHRLNMNYTLDRVIAGDLDKLLADIREMHKEHQLAELEQRLLTPVADATANE